MADAAPAHASPGPREIGGDVIVVGLILSLLAFLFLFATVVSVNLGAADRASILPGVIRLAHSALAGICFLIAVGAYRLGRTGWWWYAVWGLLPLLQFWAMWLWFGKARKAPVTWRRWTL